MLFELSLRGLLHLQVCMWAAWNGMWFRNYWMQIKQTDRCFRHRDGGWFRGKLKGTEFVNQIFRGLEFSFSSNFFLRRVISSTPFDARWELRFISSLSIPMTVHCVIFFLKMNLSSFVIMIDWLNFNWNLSKLSRVCAAHTRSFFFVGFAIFILFCY